MKIKLETLKTVTGASLFVCGKGNADPDRLLTEVSIDSRTGGEDAVFFPFRGERQDAHGFIPQVLERGAVTFSEETPEELQQHFHFEMPLQGVILKVSDTLEALQKLGGYFRSLYRKPVIGVTGSVGKTTTREMITAALQSGMRVFYTRGNQNSQIGVPLTLCRILDEPTDAAVLEMGISEPGGMDRLTEMVRPDMAVVTKIGVAHIEFMGSQEKIRDEKLRITGRMGDTGLVFLNGDDPLLRDAGNLVSCRALFYGTGEYAEYRAENIRETPGFTDFIYVHGASEIPVHLHAMGAHNVLNATAALAVAENCGLEAASAAEALSGFQGQRQRVTETKQGAVLIDDAYNASPDSMKASLSVLAGYPAPGKRVAVLGDMFELGPDTDDYHREVGKYLNSLQMDAVLLLGEKAALMGEEIRNRESVFFCGSISEAAELLEQHTGSGDVILVKASNGMHLSELVRQIEK